MTITIDLEVLKEYGITPNEYVYLVYLIKGKPCDIKLELTYERLTAMGLIKFGSTHNPVPKLTQKSILLLKNIDNDIKKDFNEKDEIPVEDWIDEYRNLFPKGVRSGGYLVKGSKQGCINKMKRFLSSNPNFNRDIILVVTKDYVNRKKKDGYRLMKMADYFIEKQGVSMLFAECEEKLSELKSTNIDKSQEDWGRDV